MLNTNEITDGITTGVEIRRQRGLEMAALFQITKRPDGGWTVPSASGGGRYTVFAGAQPCCTCLDHKTRRCKCKHMYAVEYVIQREQNADGSTTITQSVRVTATKRTTYPQDWPAYNAAQQNEKREFQSLLFNLCKGLPTPPQVGRGQRRLPMSDAVFCAVFKVYSTVSARRFTSDLCDAQAKGYIEKVPHFNSVLNYLETPDLFPILTGMIEQASLPLRTVETDFAVDSTGFTSSRFVRWFDHKYNTVRQEHDWVKAHLICGVKTNVVTAVEIHERNSNDSPILPSLLDTTARNFRVAEVSADKQYASEKNFRAIASHGADAFLAFREGTTGNAGGMFRRMYHYFCFNRDTYLKHYHKRSNVESTVMMIKSKFGDSVRSKTDVAMKNEALCKVLVTTSAA